MERKVVSASMGLMGFTTPHAQHLFWTVYVVVHMYGAGMGPARDPIESLSWENHGVGWDWGWDWTMYFVSYLQGLFHWAVDLQ